MKGYSAYVGLDVHKETIAVAIADARSSDVRFYGVIKNTPEAVVAMIKKLGDRYKRLRFVYEAGPCGYGLYRQINATGHMCEVISFAHTPRRAGDRVKTDRRDAIMLARLSRAGEPTTVWVPDETHEAMRDLIRAREVAVKDIRHARQRIQGFLLRHGPPICRSGLEGESSCMARQTKLCSSRPTDRIPDLPERHGSGDRSQDRHRSTDRRTCAGMVARPRGGSITSAACAS